MIKLERFIPKAFLIFSIAFGSVIGSALLSAIATAIFQDKPIRIMLKVAEEIKIWAMVAAIGGTFSWIRMIETGIFDGELALAIKQIIFIVIAFSGAHCGYWLIAALAGGGAD